MANDQATLRGYLQSAVRDSSNETWTTTEMNNAIDRAVRNLWPRVVRPVARSACEIEMVTETYYYNLPTGVLAIDVIVGYDSGGVPLGALQSGTWEIVGDVLGGSGQLHVHPAIVDGGLYDTLYGSPAYGRYDTSSNLIPDDYIELVVARAATSLLHALKADRARFLQWQNTDQNQNVSLNEMLELINNAEQRERELSGRTFSWRKPRPGRQ